MDKNRERHYVCNRYLNVFYILHYTAQLISGSSNNWNGIGFKEPPLLYT